jgi:hypothetical protein
MNADVITFSKEEIKRPFFKHSLYSDESLKLKGLTIYQGIFGHFERSQNEFFSIVCIKIVCITLTTGGLIFTNPVPKRVFLEILNQFGYHGTHENHV